GVAGDGVRVHPSLVGEGAGADERLVGAEVHVGDLVDVARHFRQVPQAAGPQHLETSLQRQVGDHAHQIDVAAALADAVHRALHLRRPFGDGGQGVGDGDVTVVVTVDADLDPQRPPDLLDALGDLLGQRAAVGVAQDDDAGPRVLCGPERLEGV